MAKASCLGGKSDLDLRLVRVVGSARLGVGGGVGEEGREVCVRTSWPVGRGFF